MISNKQECGHTRAIHIPAKSHAGHFCWYTQWCPDCGSIYVYHTHRDGLTEGWFPPGHERWDNINNDRKDA